MAESSKKITVYQVKLEGTHETEATSTQDAIDKTVAYFAENLNELTYTVSERQVWVTVEEE